MAAMRGPGAAVCGASGKLQRRAIAAAKPEKSLNRFVRVLATGELVGNALGTLASLWATVVLLAGYRSSLDPVDFRIATVMVFVEAFRVFIRNFKFDNQSLFGTTKALRSMSSSFARMLARPREGSEVLLIIGGVITAFEPSLLMHGRFFRVVLLTFMSKTWISETPRLMRRLQQSRPLLLWAILIIPFVVAAAVASAFSGFTALPDILTQLVALVLLNLRPPRIGNLTSGLWGRRLLYVSKVISFISLASCLVLGSDVICFAASPFTTLVLLFGSLQNPSVPNSLFGPWIDVAMHISFLLALALPLPVGGVLLGFPISIVALLAVLLIGNLQIPAAVAQIVLSSWRIIQSLQLYSQNMVASVVVFYVLALCQGSLYIMACILAMFSFFPRRSLVRSSGFRSKWGKKAVDLYYERAYTTRMEIGVFAEDRISLASFVADSLNPAASSSPEMQLAGVRVLHSFLQRRDSNEELISVITRSEKAVPTLISMLGWTFEQDRDIRLFAARVIAELSSNLRISEIPGAVKLVSLLLDAENQPASEIDGGNGDDGSIGAQGLGDNEIGDSARNEQGRQDIVPEAADDNGDNVVSDQTRCQECTGNGGNASNPPAYEQLGHRGGNNGGCCSWVCRCWHRIEEKWSIPEEPPLTYQDSLPILGTVILERLACDVDNCEEIVKTTNLVPKIVGLISYTSSSESSNDNALIRSSLDLVRRLATTGRNIVRHELWESPFLLSNLACVLEDSRSSPEVWKPAIDIIATMALDEGERQGIGRVQVIIRFLVGVFIIGRDGPTTYCQSLRAAAGEALSNLAIESPANCLAILEARPEYELVERLKDMLGNDEYRCAAASLLGNCSMIWGRLSDPGVSNHLSSALPVVLENIMTAEGKQLEALIGLASKICSVLPPERSAQGLESHIIGAAFVQKLVDTLNSNKKPSPEYPRMRRAIIELVISFLERHPRYMLIIFGEGMLNALSKVEMTPSKVENYRVFLGNGGVVLEHGDPLRDLVGRAKRLIHPANQT
ncbi:uncharacterized protein LOC111257346 [Setaria italica]|uniref:uncharacterized protein LOC111257346 n=1 Tax=Setaria italica TaxID=4555 RepID=UPI000BE5752E|nr:uncharacterized protein LOC111257346 [Setaria italica]